MLDNINDPVIKDKRSLSEIFLEIRIMREKPKAPHSYDPYGLGPQWFFLSGPDGSFEGNVHDAKGLWCPRYCDPRGGVVSAVVPHMLNSKINSFELIRQWDDSGIKLFARGIIGTQFVCWINEPFDMTL